MNHEMINPLNKVDSSGFNSFLKTNQLIIKPSTQEAFKGQFTFKPGQKFYFMPKYNNGM
jgi:hypothetical protein